MDDEIETLVRGASREQLQALLALADAPDESVDDIMPRLADPEALREALEAVLGESGRAVSPVAQLTDAATSVGELQALQQRADNWLSQARRESFPEAQAAALLLREGARAALWLKSAEATDRSDVPDAQARFARYAHLLVDAPLAELFRRAAAAPTPSGAPSS